VYTVTPTSGDAGNCVGTNFTITVTVNPIATIANKTASTCSGTGFTVTPSNGGGDIVPSGTTYAWSSLPVVTGGLTGGATATGQSSINGTLTNPTNTPQTATYTVTPRSGTCNGPTFTVVATINPRPVVPNQTATICSGTAFTTSPTNNAPTTIVPSGTTYTWTVVDNTSVTGESNQATGQSSISQTLTNNTNVVQTVTYTVTPRSGADGNCVGSTFTIVVTVNPKPVVPNQTATICSGTAFSVLPINNPTATIIPASTTYTWTVVDNVNVTGDAAQTIGVSTIGQTLTNLTNTAQTVVYTVTPTSGVAGNCVGSTFTVTVTVSPRAAIANTTATACSGSSFSVTPTNGTDIVPLGTTYAWSSLPVVTGGLTGGATATGQSSISGTLTNPTNTPQTATYTVTPTSGTCVGPTFNVVATINPKPVIVNKTSTICSGDAFSVTPVNGSDIVPASTTYIWTISTNTNITGQSAQSSAQSSIGQTLTNLTNSAQTITYTVTPTSGAAGNCVGSTFTVIVTVSPKPRIANKTATTCSGVGFTVTPTNGTDIVPSGIRYAWSAPTVTGGLTGGVSATGQTSITGTLTNPTNTQQTATYTVTPTSGSCVGPTFTVVVTLNPKPVIANKTVVACSGAAFSVIPINGSDIVPSSTTYTWLTPTVTGLMTGGAGGTAQSSVFGTLTNSTTTTQTATYTVTPTIGSCSGSTFTVVATINPTPTVNTPTSQVLCNGSSSTAVTFSGTVAGTTYFWTNNNTAIGLAANGSGNISSFTATNSTNAPIVATITVTPIFTNGGQSCSGTPRTFTITVNPTPTVADQTNIAFCRGSSSSIITLSGSLVSGTTYDWSNSNTAIGLAGSGSGNIASFVTTNTTNAAISGLITVTPKYTNGGITCAGASKTFTITINPVPTVTKPTNQTICVGAGTSTVTFGGSLVTNTVYNWTNNNTAIGLAASGTGNISSFTATNTTNAPITATITVTPSFTNAGSTCAGASQTFSITVNPKPAIPDQTVTTCTGSTFSFAAANSGSTIVPSSTTYTWTIFTNNPNLTGQTASASAQSTISQTLTSSVSSNQDIVYEVTPRTGSCVGDPFKLTVSVNNKTIISNIAQTVCTGESFSIAPSGAISGTTYTWNSPTVTGGLTGGTSGTTQNTISGTLSTVSNTTQSATYSVTPVLSVSSACTANPFSIVITVVPKPVIGNQTASICSGNTVTIAPVNSGQTIVPSSTRYTWIIKTDNADITGQTANATPATSFTQTLTGTTNAAKDIVYTVTPQNGNCAGTSFDVTVTVTPRLVVPDQDLNLCSGGTFTVTPANAPPTTLLPDGTTYTWNTNLAGFLNISVYTNIFDHVKNDAADLDEAVSGTPSYTNTKYIGNTTPNIISYVGDAQLNSILGGTAFGQYASTKITGFFKAKETGTYTFTFEGSDAHHFKLNGNVIASEYGFMMNNADPLGTNKGTVTLTAGQYYPIQLVQFRGNYTSGSIQFYWKRPSQTAWQQDMEELYAEIPSSYTGISGITIPNSPQSSISQTLSNSTSAPITVKYVVTPVSSVTGNCVISPFLINATVNPTPSIADAAASVCSENNYTFVSTNNADILPVGTTYTWTISTNNTDLTGQTAASTSQNSFSQTLVNTTNVAKTIEYTLTPTFATCTGTAFKITLTVNPKPIVPNQSATICSGESFTISPTNDPPNTLIPNGTKYTWRNDLRGFLNYQAFTNLFISPPNDKAGLDAFFTGSPAASGIKSIDPSGINLLNWNNASQVSGLIGYNIADFFAYRLTGFFIPSETGTYTFSVEGDDAVDVLIDGNAVVSHYGGHAADPVGTHTGTISMQAGQSYAIQVRHQETWGGEALKMYWKRPSQSAWQQDETELYAAVPVTNSSISGMSAQTTPQSSVSQTLVNTTNVPVTVTYVVKPIGASTGNCTGNTFNVDVTVNPKPTIANKTASICSGGSVTINPVNGTDIVPANTTYTWTISSDNTDITGQTAESTAQSSFSQSLVNTTNAPKTIVYTVTPTSGAAGNCVGSTFTVTVTVNPIPLIPNELTTICSGNAFTITPSGTSGSTIVPVGTTYTWSVAANTNVTGQSNQSNAQNNISQTLTNLTNASETVIYTVSPVANGCTGNNFTLSVVVAPKPIIANISAAICSHETLQVTPTNGSNIVPANTEYTWTILTDNNSITGQAAQNVAQSSISQHLINTSSSVQTMTYTVTPNAGSCTGSSFVLSVTVNPIPLIANKATTVCSDYAFVVSPSGGSDVIPASTKYTWTILNDNSNLTGQSAISVLQNNISQTLHNTTNINQTIVYTVTPTSGAAGSCVGLPFTTTVTVTPTPVIPNLTNTICSGGTFTVTPENSGTTIVPAGTTYTWTIRTPNNNLSGQSAESTAQNNISQTLVNSTNVNQDIVYEVTPTSGNCVGTPFLLTVSVNPTPVIPNQFATVCSGGIFTVSPQNNGSVIVPVGTTYTWTVVPNANVTGTSDVTTATNNISQQLVNTSSTDQTVVYTVTPTSGNCVGSSFEISVIVHAKIRPLDQMSFVCSGQTFNATAMGSVPVGTLYSWTVPSVTGGLTGGTTGTAQNNITGTLINPTNTVQTATYTVTPILVAPFDLCEVYDFVTVVTIHPKPTIANVSAQICSSESYSLTPQNIGSDIVPLNTRYTWTIQTNNTNIAGQNSQFAPQNSFAQQLVNLTNTDQTIVYLVTPRSGMCSGDNFTVTITVHPKPSIMPQVATVCSGNAFVVSPVNTGINIVPAGTTYTWTVLTNNNNILGQSDVSVSSNTVSQVLTNTTNQSQNLTYQVTPTSGAGGGCVGNNFFVHVTVTPKPFVLDQQTEICSGSTFSVIPADGNGNIIPGGSLYSWNIFTNNSNITGQANETNEHPVIYQTLVNTSNVDQTIVYEVRPRSGSCIGTTFKVSVVVHPAPTVPNQQITICSENAFTLNPSSIVGAVVPTNSTYTWTIATNNNALTGQQAQNIGQAVISQTLSNTTNTQQTIVYSVASVSGVTGGCAGSPFTITVQVDPRPTISNQTAEVCSGGSFVASPSNGNGNIVPAGTTYTYTIETNNNLITGQSAQSNAQNNISQALVNTTNTDQVIVYRVTPTAGNCIGSSFLLTVTVHPKPTIPAAVQTICSGSSFLITPLNGGSTIIPANTTYTWTVANNVSITGATNQTTAQNNISQTLTSSSFVPQDVIYTVTPTSGAAGSCVGGTFTVTITVNPIPTVNGINNQVICNGSTTTGVIFTGNVAGTIYNWSNTNTAIGLGASGVGNIASFVTTNTTNATISGTITAVPIYTNAGLSCTGASTSFTIAVNPIPTVNAVANQTICVGGSTTLVTPTGNVVGTVYNWTSSNTAIGLAASGTGNVPSFITTNTGNTPISSTITITPTYTNGNVSCSGAPIIFTITVNPIPTVNGINNQVICNGSTTTAVTFTGNVAGTVYNWSNTNTAIGLGGSGVGNIASFVTTNTTNATISGTILAVPIYTNAGLSCTGASTSFTIAVNPIPTVNAVANQTICVGGSTTLVTPTGNVVGTVYNWTSSNTAIGLAASGTGNIPSFVTINTGNTPISSTITITPTYTNGGVSCSGAPITFTITVNPIPTVNGINNQVICNGSTTTGVTFTGNVAGTVYNWSNTNTAIGLGATGVGNIASFVTTNTTNATISGTITAVPIYTNAGLSCTGAPTSFTIAVNPIPTVNAVASQELCTGSSTTAVAFSGFVPNTNYNWTNSNTTIGLGASGVGDIPSFTTINTGTLPQVATIIITPTYSNLGLTCTGSSKQFIYTVNAVPSIANITETICSEIRFTTIPVDGGVNANIVPPNTRYTWTVAANSNVSGQQNQLVPQVSISQVLTNLTSVVQTVVYTVTPISGSNGACFGRPFTVTVTINPKVTVPNQLVSICSEGSFSLTPSTFTGTTIIPAGSTFSWPLPNLSGTITGSAAGNNQNFIFGTLTNPTNTEQTAVYTITPLSGNCTGNIFTIRVEVKPKPRLSSIITVPAICTNSVFNYEAQSTVVNTSFSWSRDAIVGIQNPANSSNGNTIKEILINTTAAPIVVPYTFTLTARGCVVTETITVTILPTVQAQFASNNNLINCAPFVYNTYSTPSDFASVRWYYTDNNNVIIGNRAGYNSSFTFVQPGSYKVAMIAYHPNGCPDTLQKPVTVTTSAIVDFSPIDSMYCGPSKSVTFTNGTTYAGQGAVTYKWLIDGVVVSINETGYTHNFTTPASQVGIKKYTVTLEATTLISGCISSLTKNIYILPTPKSLFTASPSNGCAPLNISFANTSLYADTFKWYVNDSLFSTSQVPNTFVANKSGQAFTFKLVAIANSGCASDSLVQVVNTLANPVANFDTTGISKICKSAAVTINNQSFIGAINNTTGLTYQWKINNGLQSTVEANPRFWFSNSNSLVDSAYLVQLIVTSATGCKDSIQKSILVQPAPKPIFSVVGGNAICSSKDLTIRVSNVSIAKGIPQYTWSIRNTGSVNTFATVSSGTAAQPSFRIPDNTSLVDSVYEIKLMITTTDGCMADTVVNLRVHPRPSSSIVLSSLANCGNANFIATASNMASIKSNIWSWSANSPNAPTPTISISNNIARIILADNLTQQSIVYQIKVLDTTTFGCFDTASAQFTLYPKPQAKFVYARMDSCAVWRFDISNTSNLGNGDALSTGLYEWIITKRSALQQISAGALFARYTLVAPQFNFTNTGTADSLYDVKLITRNRFGCSDSTVQTFVVHAKPRAIILAGTTVADAPFNITRQNNLLAVDYPNINGAYTWRVLHPVSSATIATTFDRYSNPFTIINSDDSVLVQLIVGSLYNCAADTATVLFKTLPSIVADFDRSDSVDCSGNTAFVFTDKSISKSAKITDRFWDFGDGVTASGAQVSHTYKQPGIYWVSLYVKDANGIVSKKTYKRVIVIGPAVVDFVATNSCEGAATFFLNNSQFGYGSKAFSKIFWDFGDGNSSTLENPSHIYRVAGVYNVTLTLRGDSSCLLTSKTKSITIFGKPAADFNFTDNCINLPIQFTNKTVPSKGESNYTVIGWDFGDGNFSTQIDPSHTYSLAGRYSVRLIVSSTVCAQSRDTIVKQVTVTIPRASLIYPLVRATRNRTLTLVGAPGGKSYVWSPNIGLTGPNQQSPNAKYTLLDPNKINYTITIKDSSGCVINDKQEVWVFDKSDVFVPTAFSPNADGANDVLLPFYINIAKLNYFRIYDRWGKLIFETNDLKESWNGLVNGKQAPLETYAWTIACVDADGKLLLRKGMVTMIRD
jgi:gliding motility-associated-like protein